LELELPELPEVPAVEFSEPSEESHKVLTRAQLDGKFARTPTRFQIEPNRTTGAGEEGRSTSAFRFA
jgi:hypothetical protein